MGARIDELEQSINDLKAEMGSEGMAAPSKIKEEKTRQLCMSAAEAT